MFENLSEHEAKELEIRLIKDNKSDNKLYGYNLTKGGDGTVGFKMPKKSVEKSNRARYKKVYQYDSSGSFVKEWNSIIEASKELNISNGGISSCCLGKEKRAGGFIWSHEKLDSVKPVKDSRGQYIYQYSLDGLYIKRWNNAGEISRALNCYDTNITGCCNGTLQYAYGYIWSYEKKKKINPIKDKTIYQYSLDGKYLRSFANQREATKFLGYNSLPIGEVCRGKRRQSGGFLWSFEKYNSISPIKETKRLNNKNSKAVLQSDINGSPIKEWISVADIHRNLGYTSDIISKCCNNKRESAYGYKWSYVNKALELRRNKLHEKRN